MRNWDLLTPSIRNMIHQETKTAILEDKAGMPMDVKRWKKIVALPVL